MSIRMLVAGLPPLTADVVADACRHSPDLEVLDVLPDLPSLDVGTAIEATPVDALVLGVADDGEAIAQVKLDRHELAVIGVSLDGARAWTVELRADLVEVQQVSPAAIRSVIHEQCQPRGSVR